MLGHRNGVYARRVREHDIALDHLGKQQAPDARRGGMYPPKSLPGDEQRARHPKPHVRIRVGDRPHHFRAGRLVSIAVGNRWRSDDVRRPATWRSSTNGWTTYKIGRA